MSLILATQGGFHILDFLDSAISGYPMIILGMVELLGVSWIYGRIRLINDFESMLGKKSRWFLNTIVYLWRLVTPIFILLIIILNLVLNKKEFSGLPTYAKVIGWLIVSFVTAPMPLCAIYQLFKHRNNIVNIFRLIYN
jgi:hypothetical protein